MKNQIEAKSQNSERVYRALGRQNRTTKSINHIFATPAIAPLVIGRGKGIIQGKAPPGSSGAARGHPPALSSDRPAAPPLSTCREGLGVSQQTSLNIQFQTFNKNQYSNFYKHFNSIIMKKQILFLVVFVLAALAGINKSYGQACTPGALNPAPGVAYDYTVTITANPGTSPKYLWYVTTNVDILNGTKIANTTAGIFTATAGYNDEGTGTANINITWLPNSLGNTYYLVMRYTGTNATGVCDVQNMKVYEVKPLNTFLLAITGSDATGATVASATTCAANISAAVVEPTAPTVTYTYGTNILYYKITASGYAGNWRASIKLPALQSDQTYTNVEWSPLSTISYTTFNGFTAGTSAETVLTTAVGSDVASSVNGTDYIVKVTIANNNYQTLTDQVLTLAVDGFLPTAYAAPGSDIVGGTGATSCNQEAEFGKFANFTILARPTITGATTPAGGTFITKTPLP